MCKIWNVFKVKLYNKKPRAKYKIYPKNIKIQMISYMSYNNTIKNIEYTRQMQLLILPLLPYDKKNLFSSSQLMTSSIWAIPDYIARVTVIGKQF